MSRWHVESCQKPDVYLADGPTPCCKGCHSSAKSLLISMKQTALNTFPPAPPDEPVGKMNLTWPSAVPYVKTLPNGTIVEVKGPSPDQDSRLLQPSTGTKPQIQPATLSYLVYHGTLAPNQLRLIYLSTKDENCTVSPVHMTLEVYQDDNCPDYEAVSYTWSDMDGDSSLCLPIYIGDYWDILLQTKNCWAMLDYLRPRRGVRTLWVDAICIDQENAQERGDQVAKMGQIYSECSQVVVWLGSCLVFQNPGVYPRRHQLSELGISVTSKLPNQGQQLPQEMHSVSMLLEARYFSRVWVVQEVIKATRLILPVGNKIFWADAATALLTHQQVLTAGETRRPGMSATKWEDTKAPWFQYFTKKTFVANDLFALLALTSKSRATDHRDRLFGVIGLHRNEPERELFRPDYSLSTQHVFVGLFAYWIINQHKYQLLSRAMFTSHGQSSLTWMPDWRSQSTWEQIFQISQSQNSDEAKVISLPFIKFGPYFEPIWLLRFQIPDYTKGPGSLRNPWYKLAAVNSDTGALSLNLTQLLLIKSRPQVVKTREYSWSHPMGERSYYVADFPEPDTGDVQAYKFHTTASSRQMYMASTFKLDEMVEPNDEIFLLDTGFYLILRRVGDSQDFELVAQCSAMFCRMNNPPSESLTTIPSMRINLRDLAAVLRQVNAQCGNVSRRVRDHDVGRPLDYIFPGNLERSMPSSQSVLLPLYLSVIKENSTSRGSTSSDIESQFPITIERYLDMIQERFTPRLINGFVYLTFQKEEWYMKYRTSAEFFANWEWQTTRGKWKTIDCNELEPPGFSRFGLSAKEVSVRCKFELMRLTISRFIPEELENLYRSGVLGTDDRSAERRLGAEPTEDDYFTTSPGVAWHEFDGHRCRVRIL